MNIYRKYDEVNDEIQAADHLGTPVVWSIFPDQLEHDTGIELVDVGTDAPDGLYAVEFEHSGKRNTAGSVIVTNGMFDVDQSALAAGSARDNGCYWGHFLERLDYHADRQVFVAWFGS